MAAVYDVGTERARNGSLRIRPLRDTMSDTWKWVSESEGDLTDWRAEVQVQGLDRNREAALLDG